MSIPRTVGWGVALATTTALISGVSVFANGLIVKEFADPVVLTGARNALVGLVLVTVLVATGGVAAARVLPRRDLGWLAVIAVLGGSVPFILFFSGLAQAGGPGAAIIHKTMFVWVAMLAVPLLGERLGLAQVIAMGALLLGTLLVGPTGGLGAGGGELLILAATILWAIEVVVVRWLLSTTAVSSTLAATARMALGAVGILGLPGGHWTTRRVGGPDLLAVAAHRRYRRPPPRLRDDLVCRTPAGPGEPRLGHPGRRCGRDGGPDGGPHGHDPGDGRGDRPRPDGPRCRDDHRGRPALASFPADA